MKHWRGGKPSERGLRLVVWYVGALNDRANGDDTTPWRQDHLWRPIDKAVGWALARSAR